jgi:tRNA pseudouridine32 synthase/23S rRNA pseudouridine746 synthase
VLQIVFENANFVALDKPAGWLSVPSRAGVDDPRPCLGIELQKSHPGALPVHRLDVEVSGLVLFARNADSHRAANAWFESRTIHKLYEAWTEGAPPAWGSEPRLWESSLLRGKRRAYESPAGKPARTRAHWLRTIRVPATGAEAQAWHVEPLTGRSHQLRYELALHGFPILGDELYGAKTPWKSGAIALRAIRIDFSEVAGAADAGLPARLEVEGLGHD